MGIKNSDIKYYINKEKGVVVATSNIAKYDVEDEICSLIDKSSANITLPNEAPHKITAKAKLSNADKYSDEKGKNIARRRLLIKYYKERIKTITTYLKVYEDLVTRIKISLEHCERSVEKLEKNLKDDIE